MKLLKTLLIALPIMGFAGTPVETVVPIEDVYVPMGFDTNDSSEVIVTGWLPNLCHKSPMTKAEVKGKTINITISALRYDATNPFCPEMIVPFVKSVNVGLLDKGKYDIKVNDNTPYAQKSDLHVSESTSSAVDEYVYANVEYVEKAEGSQTVTLKGHNPSDCFILDEIKFVSNKKNTFSVLPVMKQIRDFCPMKMQPFAYDVEVPNTLNKKKVLLHVRGMDGHSVNTIFAPAQ